MWAVTTAPRSRPPNPGAGSTGSTILPRASRRVGANGRVCQTSSSANNIVVEGNADSHPRVSYDPRVSRDPVPRETLDDAKPSGGSDVLADEGAQFLGR